MTSRALSPSVLNGQRPSRVFGVVVALVCVAAGTAVIYPLKHVAPVVSLGVVYLLAVVIVSTFWGLVLGIGTGVLSAAAFNFFHLPPGGDLRLSDGRDWVALSAFVVVAVATGGIAEIARARAREADERRHEADLAADLAQLLLGSAQLDTALELAAGRLATAVGAQGAEITLAEVHAADGGLRFPLCSGRRRIGTLVLRGSLAATERDRVADRVVPSLESILSAAMHRAELQAEVVETVALRRSDELKTAVLRAVSHDLRSPITAILTGASALDPVHSSSESVGEVRELVLDAATRLWRLIEKLLDVSVLEAGRAQPRRVWYSIDELLQEAVDELKASADFRLTPDADLPLLLGDPGQLERAFGNLLENAARYSDGKPVLVRTRVVRDRVRIRIVDQGPGIPRSEQQRIFLPFYRGSAASDDQRGSGLGLTIAKGFVELNGGRISVESVPSQGTSFVVELPVEPQAVEAPSARPGPERVGA